MNKLVVVRQAAVNRDVTGRAAFPSQPPCLDGLCYGGVDRMPWFDIDEDRLGNVLPDSLVRARDDIHRANSDLSELELCSDLQVATQLLHYSNRSAPANELIAVRSDVLAPLKGVITVAAPDVQWLGYDVVALGQQSLLGDGLFAVPARSRGG